MLVTRWRLHCLAIALLEVQMSLGRIIRQKREEMGLTLDEVARRVDYSKPYLSTIETDRVKNPPANQTKNLFLQKVLKTQ